MSLKYFQKIFLCYTIRKTELNSRKQKLQKSSFSKNDTIKQVVSDYGWQKLQQCYSFQPQQPRSLFLSDNASGNLLRMYTPKDLQILGLVMWEIDNKCSRPRKNVMLNLTNFFDMDKLIRNSKFKMLVPEVNTLRND